MQEATVSWRTSTILVTIPRAYLLSFDQIQIIAYILSISADALPFILAASGRLDMFSHLYVQVAPLIISVYCSNFSFDSLYTSLSSSQSGWLFSPPRMRRRNFDFSVELDKWGYVPPCGSTGRIRSRPAPLVPFVLSGHLHLNPCAVPYPGATYPKGITRPPPTNPSSDYFPVPWRSPLNWRLRHLYHIYPLFSQCGSRPIILAGPSHSSLGKFLLVFPSHFTGGSDLCPHMVAA